MKYYQKMTLLLALMWGFIGIQRIVIAIIMPAIQAEMKLSYTDVGLIISVTGLVWAFGVVIWAAIGDRFGRRPVIITCAILASVFSWVTGFAHTLGQMLWIRGILGLFEGGPAGPALATVSEEAPPQRRAMNLGLVLGAFMLIGVFVGPNVAVWLLGRLGSWRPVFYLISIPGLIIGITLAFVMHESPTVIEAIKKRRAGLDDGSVKVKLIDVLKYKNVIISTIISIPIMAWLWIFTGFSALFFIKIHHMGMASIGLIISASGVGGFLAEFGLGTLSDKIGRKKTIIAAAFLCACFGVAIATAPIGTSVATFTALFFFWGAFGAGMWPLYVGTLPVEAVPPEIAGTAVAIPTGVGEILGAAVMPTIAGMVADKFGLVGPMWMAALSGLVIMFLSFFYVETAPRAVARMRVQPTENDHLLPMFRKVKEVEVLAGR